MDREKAMLLIGLSLGIVIGISLASRFPSFQWERRVGEYLAPKLGEKLTKEDFVALGLGEYDSKTGEFELLYGGKLDEED